MTRAHRIATIATFELVTAVKRTGYLVATFGMPLFIAAYGALVAIPAYYASRADQEPAVYGVVDSGDLLAVRSDVRVARGQLPDDVRRTFEAVGQRAALDRAMGGAIYVFRPYAAEAAARADLVDRKIKGYFVVPPDYIANGSIDVYSPDNASQSMSGSSSRNAFSNIVRERLLSGRLDTATSARVVSPLMETRRFSVTRTGNLTDGSRTASIIRLAVPVVFLVLFLMSVLMTSSYLMQGTATEKENKVVEVLLASANPEEILAGKLFGLGAAGLIQISVWLGMLLVTGLGALPLLLSYEIEMPWVSLALAVPLFIVAFLERLRPPPAARRRGTGHDVAAVFVRTRRHASSQHGPRLTRVVGGGRLVRRVDSLHVVRHQARRASVQAGPVERVAAQAPRDHPPGTVVRLNPFSAMPAAGGGESPARTRKPA